MDSQTENIIIMTQVKALRVLLPIINDAYCSHMVHNLTNSSIKQIASAVITSVTNIEKITYNYIQRSRELLVI
jgi:thiaminase